MSLRTVANAYIRPKRASCFVGGSKGRRRRWGKLGAEQAFLSHRHPGTVGHDADDLRLVVRLASFAEGGQLVLGDADGVVASVGPVLEVVVDGGGSVGQPPLVLAYLPLDCAGQ